MIQTKPLEFRPNSIVGLKETDAKRVVEMNNFAWIVVERDGVFTPIPRIFIDDRDDRIKMKIEEEIVKDAYIG
jgi:hypothetical protein